MFANEVFEQTLANEIVIYKKWIEITGKFRELENINFEVYPKIEVIRTAVAEKGFEAVILEGDYHIIY